MCWDCCDVSYLQENQAEWNHKKLGCKKLQSCSRLKAARLWSGKKILYFFVSFKWIWNLGYISRRPDLFVAYYSTMKLASVFFLLESHNYHTLHYPKVHICLYYITVRTVVYIGYKRFSTRCLQRPQENFLSFALWGCLELLSNLANGLKLQPRGSRWCLCIPEIAAGCSKHTDISSKSFSTETSNLAYRQRHVQLGLMEAGEIVMSADSCSCLVSLQRAHSFRGCFHDSLIIGFM